MNFLIISEVSTQNSLIYSNLIHDLLFKDIFNTYFEFALLLLRWHTTCRKKLWFWKCKHTIVNRWEREIHLWCNFLQMSFGFECKKLITSINRLRKYVGRWPIECKEVEMRWRCGVSVAHDIWPVYTQSSPTRVRDISTWLLEEP